MFVMRKERVAFIPLKAVQCMVIYATESDATRKKKKRKHHILRRMTSKTVNRWQPNYKSIQFGNHYASHPYTFINSRQRLLD